MRRVLFMFRRWSLRKLILIVAVLLMLITIAFTLTSNPYYRNAVYEQYNSAINPWPSNQQSEVSTDAGIAHDGPYEMHDDETLNSIFQRLETPLYDDVSDDNIKKQSAKNLKLYNDIMSVEIDEPKVDNLVRYDDENYERASATILSLVRNKDLMKILPVIDQLETKFNSKFGYPYTFLNDEEFTEEFKKGIRNYLPNDRVVNFGKIDDKDWNMPEDIDVDKYEKEMDKLENEKVGYVKLTSYHNMCRFYSRKFYHHPLLKDYKYTWRIEPDVNFYCNIDYDIFKFMELNDKVYGFVLNLYDSPQSVRSLWTYTMEFLRENPNYINKNGAFEWLKENLQQNKNFEITSGYSTCHFWTNFEINDLDFLRSEAYEKYMDFLESKQGFYYERWGDAPVRSLALALFADKSKIHWFRDIGYHHQPYTNCPKCPPDSKKCDGRCVPGKFTPWDNLNTQNCQATWIEHVMTEEDLALY
ncbi:hypothetical protein KAFR_0E03170 [Kazachstania africana CBS 2517]|uniref:Glycosyltransferase family 15 protein n=1 Tax=Kazachstania africana (strain ATCC 22294 / BCRC 22015 / CBS 2517 / CECT 1963 / NBRC 1671 / NRRL Y-8276) TaxID=1071382 RepID=H2AVR9_KAZAF|nr:hypothetical protein KAFR_0E03170 [Kazachstania africana CBS 2517]CCF58469.1 hypothetical protein KAFR_0E03170 [Kazachstania africana CBS 2517]